MNKFALYLLISLVMMSQIAHADMVIGALILPAMVFFFFFFFFIVLLLECFSFYLIPKRFLDLKLNFASCMKILAVSNLVSALCGTLIFSLFYRFQLYGFDLLFCYVMSIIIESFVIGILIRKNSRMVIRDSVLVSVVVNTVTYIPLFLINTPLIEPVYLLYFAFFMGSIVKAYMNEK